VTYESLLRLAYKKVAHKNKEEEAAKLLLMELSKLDPHEFYLSMKEDVDQDFISLYFDKLDQYLNFDIPIQHVIGHSYFYGYEWIVNEDVLIPRPETEQLVEHIIFYFDRYYDSSKYRILDLGTGSGCIGLTLAKELSNVDIIASDISQKALDIAKQNKQKLDVDATLILSDLFENITGKFSVIVSNPPYIPDEEHVDEIVKKEPHVALYGGKLGIEFYDRILFQAKDYLEERALIAFEHGYQQKQAIHDLAKTYYPQARVIQLKDLAGKDRFTFIGFGGILSLE
jgi:release factor glutamine methyltransferase